MEMLTLTPGPGGCTIGALGTLTHRFVAGPRT